MIGSMGAVIAAVSKYRVDNVPLLLQPLFMLYGYGIGLAQFAYSCLIHWTCRIRYEDREALPAERNCIYSVWHGDLQSYFCVFLQHREHTWMMHPSWHLRPVQICMRLCGIDRIILGSSGHGGREAAQRLVQELRDGRWTGLAPDGPARAAARREARRRPHRRADGPAHRAAALHAVPGVGASDLGSQAPALAVLHHHGALRPADLRRRAQFRRGDDRGRGVALAGRVALVCALGSAAGRRVINRRLVSTLPFASRGARR